MQYRRNYIPGGNYFFTLVTRKRAPILNNEHSIQLLRQAFRTVRQKYPFSVDAIVILPDHLHCIWTLPPNDVDFSTRWRLIKTCFTKHYLADSRNLVQIDPMNYSRKSVWQNRFWEHTLRDERDSERHMDYIHYNPVKHGYVSTARDWPHSSFHQYVTQGIYPEHWAAENIDLSHVGHE